MPKKAVDSIETLIKLWPSYSTLARDCGVTTSAVKGWRRHGEIRGHYFNRISRSAIKHGIPGITPALLSNIAEYEWLRRHPENAMKEDPNG